MSGFLLDLHSWLRWVVLLTGAVAFVLGLVAWRRRAEPSRAAQGLWAAFVGFFDLQFVAGVLLVFLGPGGRATPWWHAAFLTIVLAFAHWDRIRARRAEPGERARRLVLGTGYALFGIGVGLTLL